DSALLSISSMLTKDIYAGWLAPGATEAQLTRFGKRCSWTLITLLVMLAIALREASSLVSLLDRKFDILVQLAPAFILGIRWAGLAARPVLIGILVGVTVALTLAFAGFDFVHKGKVAGFHPGLIGLLPNLMIAIVGSRLARRVSPGSDTLGT
ncbi:MAG: hypothetical protein KJO38_04485, partial [Gammaproteobacteria bacterium]|nr:hypothetical protein [Gammaproteobacteria bacterium]